MKERLVVRVVAVPFREERLESLVGLIVAGPALAGAFQANNGGVGPADDANMLLMTQVDRPSVPDHLLLAA